MNIKIRINKKKVKIFLSIFICAVIFSQNITASAEYDGKKAATYAKNYCGDYPDTGKTNGYNTVYPSYSGKDCTNFVSQCALYGGLTEVKLPQSKVFLGHLGNTYSTDVYWSCRKYTASFLNLGFTKQVTDWVPTSTWTLVDKSNMETTYDGFGDYMRDYKGASVVKFKATKDNLDQIVRDAEVGDVIQLRRSGELSNYHSFFVTKKSNNSTYSNKMDLFLTAHSNNRDASSNDSIRYIINNAKISSSDTIYIIHLTDFSS